MITRAVVIFQTKCGKKYEIPCHRHCDAYYIISQFLAAEDIDKTKTTEGFLDENDNFLSRIAAQKEAIRCNQVLDINELRGKELYSEDIW